ncbi:MAG TPA: rod shape-determining protein RodA [Caulobacterales bacterium]|nr:rod shape-determining protein RodA [Caulobacterales bacterium]
MTFSSPSTGTRRLADKWKRLHWGIITVLCWLAAIGVVMHLSVAGDAWNGQPLSHGTRFAVVLAVALMLAMIDLRFWLAIAYPLYAFSLLLLVAVDLIGAVHMGAQRWLDIGPLSLQPSEIMKIALVLALARYYHQLDARNSSRAISLIPPLLMIAAPTALVMKQPDLGTSLLLAGAGFGLMFLAGIRWRYIVIGALIAGAAGFWAYEFKLQDYQRDRIATFLDPEADPLGAGYHVAQSKIAIGSAGLLGQGYQKGSQSQLDFLPEKHTDFIFTMITEEFGLAGAFIVLGLFAALLTMTMMVAVRARTLFGRLASGGVAITLALYVFINTAMVIGLVPVVGIPLPLLSFGGTAMLTIMMGMALVLSVHVHRDYSPGSSGFLW